MKASDAARLLALVATLWPHVKMEGETPAAWSIVLRDVDFEDAKEAVVLLARESAFVHVSDIVKRAKVVRRSLTNEAQDILVGVVPPSDIDPDDSVAYINWLRESQQAAVDVARRRRSVLALSGA